jgi:predicted nucleic-acid-binding protein
LKIAADTNLLVRLFTADDAVQNEVASKAIREAESVILSLPVLCELVWVLRRGYRFDAEALATVVRGLMDVANTQYDEPAADAGLAMLKAGGDFADGVIAYEGRRMGADAFVSFDRKAVELVQAQDEAAQLLG